MFKKLLTLFLVSLTVLNLCGCVLIMAGLANTAKARQVVDLSYVNALDIVKEAVKVEGIEFKKAVIRGNIAEVKGKYTDGKDVRIYVSKTGNNQSYISVRVGTSAAGRKDAQHILDTIVQLAKKQAQMEKALSSK